MKTDKQYEADQQYIQEQFGNNKFDISLEPEVLDEVVTDKHVIVLKNSYTCYCWREHNRPTDYFVVHGVNITNRFLIHELIRNDFNPGCNHIFLEGFHQPNKNSMEYDCCMGS